MIVFKHKGDFKNSKKLLKGASKIDHRRILESYGREGVRVLSAATPVDTNLTASSWEYYITTSRGAYSIIWTNSNVKNGVPIVILIQYGHGTRNGGYVQGRDFINPALQPVFDRFAAAVWQEVKGL